MSIDIPILFRDNRFVVLDKPPGLPVHAGPRGGVSVEDAFSGLRRGKNGPWLAHRLDADTSGCLVVALRRAALLAAQAEFANGRAEKVYWAVVAGRPLKTSGVVEAPLAKRIAREGWRMAVDPAGQRAVTQWRLMGEGGGMAWLELRPRSGRTHQVRVHCLSLGCPIVGDGVYGAGESGRLHLLARSISLHLDPVLTGTAEPHAHMRAAMAACGYDGVG